MAHHGVQLCSMSRRSGASPQIVSDTAWSTGMAARMVVPCPGLEAICSVPPSASSAGDVEAAAVVGDLHAELVAVLVEAHHGSRGLGVLLDVLEGLEDAEVEGRLGVLRIAANAVGLDGHGQGGLACLGLEGGGQSLVGEQERVDTPGQIAEGLQGLVGVAFELRGWYLLPTW